MAWQQSISRLFVLGWSAAMRQICTLLLPFHPRHHREHGIRTIWLVGYDALKRECRYIHLAPLWEQILGSWHMLREAKDAPYPRLYKSMAGTVRSCESHWNCSTSISSTKHRRSEIYSIGIIKETHFWLLLYLTDSIQELWIRIRQTRVR